MMVSMSSFERLTPASLAMEDASDWTFDEVVKF